MTMNTSQWLVLYTKPRNEKKVAQRLFQNGFTVYCPTKKVEKQWSDRVKVVDEPLFSSYVFIHIDDAKRESVFTIPGVVRYLFWLGKPAVVREEEMVALQSFMNDFENSSLEVEVLSPQERVKISSGPLMGQEALIQKINKTKVSLLLANLHCKITVNLEKTLLKRVG